jgi:hypothetical protein
LYNFAFTDINHSALHWSIVTLSKDYQGWIVAYGKNPSSGVLVPRNATETDRRQRIAAGLAEWWETLKATKIPIKCIGIDAGYEPAVVRAWVESKRNPAIFACRGYDSQKYKPPSTSLQVWDNCHLTESSIAGRFVAHNADFWKEFAQRGFLVEPGGAGSLQIFGDNPALHKEYAAQICGEKLAEKALGNNGTLFYRWTHIPGAPWDWLDALAGCMMLGSVAGLSIGGVAQTIKKRKASTVQHISI